ADGETVGSHAQIGALREELKRKYDDGDSEHHDGEPADPITTAYHEDAAYHEGEAREQHSGDLSPTGPENESLLHIHAWLSNARAQPRRASAASEGTLAEQRDAKASAGARR